MSLTRLLALMLAAAPVVTTVNDVQARPRASAAASQHWMLQVGRGSSAAVTTAALKRLRGSGLTTLVVDPAGLSRSEVTRLRHRARGAKVSVLGVARHGRCAPLSRCARRAGSVRSARRLARRGRSALVTVHDAAALGRLAPVRHGRLIAALAIGPSSPGSATWRAARAASAPPRLDLAAALSRRHAAGALRHLMALVGAGSSSPTAPTSPHTPTLPPASVFVATNGSDSAPCTRAAPCRTFDRAYRVAKPGEVVEVAGGHYPDTGITADASKTSSADVVFRPAGGAQVAIDRPGPNPDASFVITASHVELRDMSIGEWWAYTTAHDVTMRDINGSVFTIASEGSRGPGRINVIGGDYGPAPDRYSTVGVDGLSTPAVPTQVLIDGVSFHDYTLSAGSSAHVECLQVYGVDGLTVRNSRFRNCEVFDILLNKIEDGVAPTPSNILIENNFLQCCGGGNNPSLRVSDSWGGSWHNVTIRNNSSDAEINIGPGAPYANVTVQGNVAPRLDGSPPGVSVGNNDWYSGSAVGPGDFVAPPGFRAPSSGDFHLVPGAAPIDRGGATGPANDIDGQHRPAGHASDAGADEAG